MFTTSDKQLSTAKLWMVLVGVNHYQDSFIPNLKYCANDCEELAEALTLATKQFKEAEIIALHDGGIKPSLDEVIASIKKFRLAQPEDTILFYFSGHGELDRGNRPVLGVTNTKVIKNEANNSLSFDSATGLKLDRLLEEFRNSPAQSQLIWLDACQAKAEINGEQNNANGQIIAVLNQESQQTRPGKNFFAMLSCDQTERSWEFDELGHGLFTYSLIKGLQGNAANAEGKIGVNGLFNYVKNNIAEYLELKKHPVTTEAANNSAKGLVIKPTKQVKRFPANVYQNPRKIDSSGEVDLIIGAVAPVNSRKALICDRLSSSLTDIEFCRLLQDRGGFTVEHCFLEAKTEKNLAEAIAGYLQDKNNETVLLYLAGEIEQSDRAEYSLAVNPKSKVNLNWLGQLIRDSPVKEAIAIVDVIQQQDNYPDIRDILNPDANRSLCVIAASSTKADRKLISQLVEILTVAAEVDQQFWAATLITQLQKKADFPQELRLQKAGLYSSSTAINILLPKSRRSNKQTYDLNICPYKSLQAFTQDDAYFFHGREALIAEILEKLATNPFLAVVGASGSGKSSVVRAGVIPQLTAEGLYSPQSDEYLPCKTYVMRPGDNPLTALATALAANDPELAEGFLHIGVQSFVSWLQQQPQTISVLVIDQFEELFTTKHKSQSNSFIEFILQAIALSPDCFKVIITLRDDFLKDCLANQKIDPLFRQSHILVRPYLEEGEYRQILKQPAQKVGLTIEDELVNVLLQELQTESLPLLQFALDELWRKRTPGELTLANYQENIGGLGAILGKKAEITLNGLNKEQQECAQAIFQDLVQLGEGKEDTRRRVSKRKLAKTRHQAVFDSTLKALVNARLLVISLDNNTLADNAPNAELANQSKDGETTVEIAHEILIRNWDTLRWWLNTNRNQIRLTRELEQRAEEWVNTPKDKKDDFLLSEASLIKYQDLYRDRADELSDEVNQFVRLSIEKGDRLKQEEEERRNRELAQERKALYNLRRFTYSLIIGSLISLSLAGLAIIQWRKSRVNEVDALLNSGEALLSLNQELNALVTELKVGRRVRSMSDFKPKISFLGNIQNTFQEVREFNRLEDHADDVNSVVFIPNKEIIASASADGEIKLWSLQGKLIQTRKTGLRFISKMIASPDGQTLIYYGGNQGIIHIWNPQAKNISFLRNHSDVVNDLKFSPDGKIIASASKDGTINLWNSKGQLLHTLQDHADSVSSIAFSPDGKFIASASWDNTVKVWTVQGQLIDTLEDHSWSVTNVAFSPDGKFIASASWDKTIKLWNTEGKLLHTLEGHTDIVEKVVFSPDGKTIVSASNDLTAKLWNINGQLITTLVGHDWDDIEMSVSNLVFSPDAQTIATAINDKTVKLWNLKGELLHTLEGHSWYVYDIAFSPDSQTIATASGDGTVKLWNYQAKLSRTLKGHDFSVNNVIFSPDGQTIATASRDKTVKLWNLKGELLHTLKGHTQNIQVIKFSPNSNTIAAASKNGIVKLWDIQGQFIDTFKIPPKIIHEIDFVNDGQKIYTDGKFLTESKVWNLLRRMNLHNRGESTLNFKDISITKSPHLPFDTVYSINDKNIIELRNYEGIINKFEGHTDRINTIEVSSDGKIIASGSDDKTVKLWNIKSGTLISTIRGHTLFISSIKFALNNKILVSGGGDDTVKLWNIESGTLISTLQGHTADIKNLAVSPDGKTIASASDDGTVKLWSLDLNRVMSSGCDWVQDYLANNPNVSEENRKICDGY